MFGIFKIINFDYDNYYLEIYKNAIKYGMTRDDFWFNCEWKEYFAYEEAYYEKLHETNHIQGMYNYIALTTVVGNIFKNKGDKALEYPDKNNYTIHKEKSFREQKNTVKVTKENMNKILLESYKNVY